MVVEAQTETLNAVRSSRLRISAFSEVDVALTGSVSWAFVPKYDILVTALGFIGDPLTGNPRGSVAAELYDRNGRLLSSTSFDNGGTLIGGNLYDPITPVRLNAGQRVVIGFDTSAMLFYESKNAFFVDPNITFLDSHSSMLGGVYYDYSRTNLVNNRVVPGVTFQFSLVNGGGIVDDPVMELWNSPSRVAKGGVVNRTLDSLVDTEIWSSFSGTGKGGAAVMVPEPAYLSLVLLGLATFFAIKVRGRDA